MISAALLALVSLSTPASASLATAYAGDSVAASKGHPTIVARTQGKASAPTVCHPDPSKGRACRHAVVQAEQSERPVLAVADAAVTKD